MYKYSAFRINYKSFRSSMSKNFTVIPGSSTVIPGLTGDLTPDRPSPPSSPAPTGDLTRSAIRHPRLRPGIS